MSGPETRRASLCVVLGSPRSGTTWLQRLLAMSPSVATPQETHLFWLYLEPQRVAWLRQAERLERAVSSRAATSVMEGRLTGLPSLLDHDDLLASQRALVDSLVAGALEARPGSSVVVEKSPSNALCVDVAAEVAPEAKFVHIIRDPRDVMRSALHAADSWGERWAPPDPRSAARMWVRHVEGGRKAAALGPERYHELRYEQLRADPVATLGPLLSFLGLDDDPRALVDAESTADERGSEIYAFSGRLMDTLAALPEAPFEPPEFGNVGGRAPLDRLGRFAAEVVAGPTARSLGYDVGSGVPEVARRASVTALTGHTYLLRATRAARRRLR